MASRRAPARGCRVGKHSFITDPISGQEQAGHICEMARRAAPSHWPARNVVADDHADVLLTPHLERLSATPVAGIVGGVAEDLGPRGRAAFTRCMTAKMAV